MKSRISAEISQTTVTSTARSPGRGRVAAPCSIINNIWNNKEQYFLQQFALIMKNNKCALSCNTRRTSNILCNTFSIDFSAKLCTIFCEIECKLCNICNVGNAKFLLHSIAYIAQHWKHSWNHSVCRCCGPAHPPPAHEPPASMSAGLFGSATVAIPRMELLQEWERAKWIASTRDLVGHGSWYWNYIFQVLRAHWR